MDDIQFNNDQEFVRRTSTLNQESFVVRAIFATGLIKTREGANYTMIGFIALCLIVAFFIINSLGKHAPSGSQFQEGQSVLLPPQGTR